MGMWIIRNEQTFYKSGGRLFDGTQKRVEYDPDTFKPISKKKIEEIELEPKPQTEGPIMVLGSTKEELESMTIQEIYKTFGLKPRKGFTKEKLIQEILGAVE